jgi:hypothetical protein
MEGRFFAIYEECVPQFNEMRGRDKDVLFACCCVCGFNDGDFTLKRYGEKICDIARVSVNTRDVALVRLMKAGYVIRPKRGYYVVNPYVCFKGSGRGRKDLIKKWVFVDLSVPKADVSALKPNEEFDI